jgi:hypothetical protein
MDGLRFSLIFLHFPLMFYAIANATVDRPFWYQIHRLPDNSTNKWMDRSPPSGRLAWMIEDAGTVIHVVPADSVVSVDVVTHFLWRVQMPSHEKRQSEQCHSVTD